MTVVAARKYEKEIVIAADSIVTCGSRIMGDRAIATPKLFQQNGLVVGLTGDSCEGSLMEIFTRNHKPSTATIEGVIDFLFEFDDWMRKRDANFKPENHYLIAFAGKLFRSYGSFQVIEVPEFAAIGAGEEIAVTAMHLGKSPAEAVQVACDLSVWCNTPIVETKQEFLF